MTLRSPMRRTRPLVAARLVLTLLPLLVASHAAHSQGQGQPQSRPPQVFEEEIEPQRYANSPEVAAFIDNMVARYDFDRQRLQSLFQQVAYSATAVQLSRPAASPATKNWQSYLARFTDAGRINNGVKFWRDNRATLERAAAQYGVPPEIIVGILGVETIYGRYMGDFRVLDVLTTLSFNYPDTPNRDARQQMFRENLVDFLLWTRDSDIDPQGVRGSYNGAIGIPQFMPSSVTRYAVDYDGSQTIDLRTSAADAIGSVANYLQQNGWQAGRPVVWNIARDVGSQGIAAAAADGKPEPHWALDQLLKAGMLLDQPNLDYGFERATPVTVIDLPTPGRPTEYALGLQNFYALTRYNRSFFYAMAVWQLGSRIKSRMVASGELPTR